MILIFFTLVVLLDLRVFTSILVDHSLVSRCVEGISLS